MSVFLIEFKKNNLKYKKAEKLIKRKYCRDTFIKNVTHEISYWKLGYILIYHCLSLNQNLLCYQLPSP